MQRIRVKDNEPVTYVKLPLVLEHPRGKHAMGWYMQARFRGRKYMVIGDGPFALDADSGEVVELLNA